jgi:hypothetical protein
MTLKDLVPLRCFKKKKRERHQMFMRCFEREAPDVYSCLLLLLSYCASVPTEVGWRIDCFSRDVYA